MMANLCVVVVTYDRATSLKRLLLSLESAAYLSHKVDLIVSIDFGPCQAELKDIVDNFFWPFGEKKMRLFDKNMGLRAHILNCGSFTDDYDAIILLEDDLVVSKDFYIFTLAALEQYMSEPEIAGISLYAPSFNEMAGLTFQPAISKYDTYFLRSAQSWGQCWTKSMWQGFISWYQTNSTPLLQGDDMPARIYSWPESSWKKYFMKYLAVTGKTWVYPYISQTTNFTEVGTHNKSSTSLFQTVLSDGRVSFNFPKVGDGVSYDLFFEREAENIKLPDGMEGPVEFDLYGTKYTPTSGQYLATIKFISKNYLMSFGISLKPHENNALCSIPGSAIYVYNIEEIKHLELKKYSRNLNYSYYSSLGWYESLIVGLVGFVAAVRKRLNTKYFKLKLKSVFS